MKETHSSIESWTLMSLIYRDLDDGDYENALLLSERLYAINNENTHYKFLYANCLYHCLDYTATYTILKAVKSVPCLNLFAKCCLELGKLEESKDKQTHLWEEGVQALKLALDLNELPKRTYWGDELASITTRHHMPSRSSICNLLGDLFVKLDNIRAAAIYYWDCLKNNPYKLSAYTKLCDIAPDCIDFNKAKLPKDIFVDFNPNTTDLSKSPHPYLPAPPSAEISEISFTNQDVDQIKRNHCSMPDLRDDYHDITVEQLRALIKFSPKILDDSSVLSHEFKRGDIENKKDMIINNIKSDIKQMKVSEAYKNKHGLHKKPPVQPPQKLKVELLNAEEEQLNEDRLYFESIKSNTPPRLVSSAKYENNDTTDENTFPTKKAKSIPNKVNKMKNISLNSFFLPQSPSSAQQYISPEIGSHIIDGMNKIIKVLCILANGYLYQSFYHCEKAALELQKLDDQQYNSARVLCILGKAYYDAGDYQSARQFFKHSFVTSPWYCEGVPFYSTCLWYLEKEKELNLLAFKMKDNKSHQFEAFIAAGNWTKYAKGGNEATQWFEKAIKLDPSQSYGHALLGYEEWEKGNSLGAKQYFSRSMIANKRSYIGWYGMATAYQGMEEYTQAKTLLAEAIRLHPRHPVVLATMAEVLLELEDYEAANEYIDKSLSIKPNTTSEKLKAKIELKIEALRANDMVTI